MPALDSSRCDDFVSSDEFSAAPTYELLGMLCPTSGSVRFSPCSTRSTKSIHYVIPKEVLSYVYEYLEGKCIRNVSHDMISSRRGKHRWQGCGAVNVLAIPCKWFHEFVKEERQLRYLNGTESATINSSLGMWNPALTTIELTIDDLTEDSVFEYIDKLGKGESTLQHCRNLLFDCSETSKISQHHYFAIELGIHIARKLENITIIFPYDKFIDKCDVVVELLDICLLEFRASLPIRKKVTASVNKSWVHRTPRIELVVRKPMGPPTP